MKLNALLRIHDEHQTRISLKNNLGDGYLLQKNPLYRRVREGALKAKFKFSADRFGDYEALALTALPDILSKRTIPYLDNVSPLRKVEKKVSGFFSLSNLPPLKGNQIFHESAHAIAHGIIQKLTPVNQKNKLSEERSIALKLLLEESFANACESLANAYSDRPVHDEFLFKNAYVMESENLRKTFRIALGGFGFDVVFRLMILSFLHANFLKTSDIEVSLIRSIRIAFGGDASRVQGLNHREIRCLTKIFQAGLDLDTEFTEFTNRFCLRLAGVKTELRELFQYDFLTNFEDHSTHSKCLDALIIAVRP